MMSIETKYSSSSRNRNYFRYGSGNRICFLNRYVNNTKDGTQINPVLNFINLVKIKVVRIIRDGNVGMSPDCWRNPITDNARENLLKDVRNHGYIVVKYCRTHVPADNNIITVRNGKTEKINLDPRNIVSCSLPPGCLLILLKIIK